MRSILVTLMLCLATVWAVPASAQDDATRDPAIEQVIQQQLSAFQANDLDTAFSFASPTIQEKFGSSERFGQMVEMGYPMVWRPSRYQMQRIVQTEMGPVQVVLFEDGAGRLHEAGYLMQQIDGVWRINGVKLRALPGVGS